MINHNRLLRSRLSARSANEPETASLEEVRAGDPRGAVVNDPLKYIEKCDCSRAASEGDGPPGEKLASTGIIRTAHFQTVIRHVICEIYNPISLVLRCIWNAWKCFIGNLSVTSNEFRRNRTKSGRPENKKLKRIRLRSKLT